MIAHIRGHVLSLGAGWVVVEASGLGYRLLCPPSALALCREGNEVSLYTSLIVREDSMTLYGFATCEHRDAFELVQQASGVGPKLALSIVSVWEPDQLADAVMSNNIRALTQVPGIGKKGAEKIIIELREKIAILKTGETTSQPSGSVISMGWVADVSEGLQSLGWNSKDADRACEMIADRVAKNPDMSLSDMMRAALKTLAKA